MSAPREAAALGAWWAAFWWRWRRWAARCGRGTTAGGDGEAGTRERNTTPGLPQTTATLTWYPPLVSKGGGGRRVERRRKENKEGRVWWTVINKHEKNGNIKSGMSSLRDAIRKPRKKKREKMAIMTDDNDV